MKAFRTLITTAALSAVGVVPALAQTNALTNGSFSADFSGWDTFGDVIVLGPVKRAVLSTASLEFNDDGLGAGFNNNSGISPVDFSFATELGGVPLASLDIDPVDGPFVTEGSAIRQSFSATAGDIVTVAFDWAFLSMDSLPNDFGFLALNDTVVRFANMGGSGSSFYGDFGDFSLVNWNFNANSFSYIADSSGLQSLVLGVVDTGDYNLTSELRVDNVSILVSAVPEPETYAMLLAGMGLVGAFTRRRKDQASQA